MESPYLSPPAEYLPYVDDLTNTKPVPHDGTIDPQKLNTNSITSPDVAQAYSLTATAGSSAKMIKNEQIDEDYGFSKFAAERDAARNEDEMDEDTKLLMSEEGRKLSSKERRQLRNKVSARNFRERRKEYITHLEALVTKHQNEATTYKNQVDVLKVEKDELAQELAKLKISISAALESNKLAQQQASSSLATNNPGPLSTATLTRSFSRCDTPSKEMSLIPNLTKDINPYSSSSNFSVDWPLSNMASPSAGGSFDFNLHNYTSVFSMRPSMPYLNFSEKELCGKDCSTIPPGGAGIGQQQEQPSECLAEFERVLSSILGENWNVFAFNS